MTGYVDIAKDFYRADLSAWGVFVVSTDEWLYLTDGLTGGPADGLAQSDDDPWDNDAVLLVTPTSSKVIGNGPWHDSWMGVLVEELQTLAMDLLGKPFPTVKVGNESVVLEPDAPEPGIVHWTARGEVICQVGDLESVM